MSVEVGGANDALGFTDLPESWQRLIQVNVAGCWIWTGTRNKDGYGKARSTTAPRAVYCALGGVIPEGLQLDHLCKTPPCVNPQHLEPVTFAENMRRRYLAYTHCANGHPFDEKNTYIRPNGYRDCRICTCDRQKRYQRRRAAAKAAA